MQLSPQGWWSWVGLFLAKGRVGTMRLISLKLGNRSKRSCCVKMTPFSLRSLPAQIGSLPKLIQSPFSC